MFDFLSNSQFWQNFFSVVVAVASGFFAWRSQGSASRAKGDADKLAEAQAEIAQLKKEVARIAPLEAEVRVLTESYAHVVGERDRLLDLVAELQQQPGFDARTIAGLYRQVRDIWDWLDGESLWQIERTKGNR